jgi:hypothetical protein
VTGVTAFQGRSQVATWLLAIARLNQQLHAVRLLRLDARELDHLGPFFDIFAMISGGVPLGTPKPIQADRLPSCPYRALLNLPPLADCRAESVD